MLVFVYINKAIAFFYITVSRQLLQQIYMFEQSKKGKFIKVVLVAKKKSSLAEEHSARLTDSCFDTPSMPQPSLTQDIKKLNFSVTLLADTVSRLTTVFNNPLKQSSKTSENDFLKEASSDSSYFSEIEPRDRKIKISFSDDFIQEGELKKQNIEFWTAKVCQTVFSSAFQKFHNNQMSEQQAKVYCSQNIINNIVSLSQKAQLNPKLWKFILENIDKHITKEVCPYMKMKYPLAEAKFHNKSLESIVKQVDNMESYKNNIFYISSENCFDFEYRHKMNYNDLIMKLVNYLIERIDQPPQQEKYDLKAIMTSIVHDKDIIQPKQRSKSTAKTVYQQFHQQMTKVFQTVYDCGYGENDQPLHKDKRLVQKIEKYTSWAIGRKVEENLPRYSENQIKSMELQMKHPSILRILTKWCEQLARKFDPQYFLTKFDSIFTNKGRKMINMTDEIRKKINQRIQIQSEDIKEYFQTLQVSKYLQQSLSLKKALQAKQFTNMDKTQRSSGLFVVNSVKNLHTYIVLYLNRLIHGLLRVAKDVTESSQKLMRIGGTLNLLSFTINDLMRCRLSSKEEEIKKIYRHITKMSNEQPDCLKVVKVRNRLKSNTNDIQLTILFKKKYLCEIQLKGILSSLIS